MLDRTALAIVVDEEFGWALRSLAESMPVQIVDSPANRPAIESLWQDRRTRGVEVEVTIFRMVPGLSLEEHLSGLLRAMGRAAPTDGGRRPAAIHVLGLRITPSIERLAAELGLGDCRETADGFTIGATHPSAGAQKAGS